MYLKLDNTISLRKLTFVTLICSFIQLSANQQQCDSGDMFMSDSDDCSKYFLCKDGLKYHLECGNGLKFDPKTGKCSSTDDSQCENGQTKYFPFQRSKFEKSPKVSCYMSEWTSCDHKIDQLVCDSSCYSDNNNVVDVDIRSSDAKIQEGCKLTQPKRKYITVCYYTTYSFTYKGKAKFFPDDIDPSLCSHILYFRAYIDNSTLKVTGFDPWVDFDNAGYQKVTAMKAKGSKVLLVIGGWSESKDDKFSRITGTESLRATVIQNIVAYLEKYGFDGVEIDWQFPRCWQNSCSKGHKTDGANFLIFMKQLSKVLKRKNMLLSTIASRSSYIVDDSYDIKAVSKYVDWISVQCQNYHTAGQGRTGHVAALYGDGNLNVNFSVQHVLAKGVDPRKIVMAIPAFTNHLELVDPKDTGYGSIVEKGGPNGEFLDEEELLGFGEICYYVKNYNWTVVRDPEGKAGPYAYKGNQWASYDDMEDAKRKCDYIKKYKLAGVYFWNLSYEDVRNRCGCGKYPILTTIAQELLGIPKRNNLENCT